MGRLEEDEMAEGPYSRVYWSVIDDHPEVYDDDAAFAAWVRLLLAADAAWPASPHLPVGVRPRAMQQLVESGLVIRGQGARYKIKGLDEERKRRQEQAKLASNARWNAPSNAASIPASNASAMPSREEKRLAKPSQAERARDGDFDRAMSWLSERRFGIDPASRGATELARLVDQHGVTKVTEAMQDVLTANGPLVKEGRQLVFGAMKLLNPIPNVGPLAKQRDADEREAERDKARQNRIEATRRYAEELTSTT
jgi:hypothetical protein